MRRKTGILVLAAAALVAAPALFNGPTESTWAVAAGGKDVATVTLLTDGRSARAEWKGASGAPAVVVATGGKLWLKQPGGDVELATVPGVEAEVAPALLLPHLADPKAKVAPASGKVATYAWGSSTATYSWDENGPATIVVKSGTKSWTLTRKSVVKPSAVQASLFAVQPKRTAATRLAAVAGGLLGPADRSVSATAGGRGVEKGAKFADGGDYAALAELEARDEAWSESLPPALTKFQKEGKVGEGRGGDR